MAITGTIALNMNLTDERSGDIETGKLVTKMIQGWEVSAGTGADQGNLLWSDKRTLGSSATEALDFAGSLSSLFGTNVFAKVRAIAMYAAATNTTSLTVSRPASNGLPFLSAGADALTLGPGDMFMLTRRAAAGIAVSAGTGDLIQVDNGSGASADYYIAVLGSDA